VALGMPISSQMLGMHHHRWSDHPRKYVFSQMIDVCQKIPRVNLSRFKRHNIVGCSDYGA
jgi:hypothetical protein